jgi:hypothetical protein
VLIVVGYAVNDSGVAIPGVMLVVFVATMAGLLTRAPDPVPEPRDDLVAPDDDPGQSEASTAAVLAATPSH